MTVHDVLKILAETRNRFEAIALLICVALQYGLKKVY